MKLKTVKLAGFKSFVDLTQLQFQGNLTGIVGPNGCGKSNIIDALRWVMGESSAKQLRGDSMSDVIFNGSVERKQVGKAVVELLFDNSDASLGGQYARYSEIALRREVGRDGCSDYFLNGVACRRKDIVDIFLGTGLGRNSYALIEQGTISQFIEAKPEELRQYIEEAAGISKYQERRHETELHIKSTRENLARLGDIIVEVDQQLKRLKTQVQAAERYRKLKDEERGVKAAILLLHWREFGDQLQIQDDLIKQSQAQAQTKARQLQELMQQIEQLRRHNQESHQNIQQIQNQYYQVSQEVGRIEQQLNHLRARDLEVKNEQQKIQKSSQELQAQQNHDRQQQAVLEGENQQIIVQLEQLQGQSAQLQTDLRHQEDLAQNHQQVWDEFNVKHAELVKNIELMQLQIHHLQREIEREQRNFERSEQELKKLKDQDLKSAIDQLEATALTLQSEIEVGQQEVVQWQQQISEQRGEVNQLIDQLAVSRDRLQSLLGRQSSLEALQQTIFQTDDQLIAWLKSHRLDHQDRLVQKLKVVSGWELAVEAVLGGYLQAICVENLDQQLALLPSNMPSELTLFDAVWNESLVEELPSMVKLPRLLDKITPAVPLGNLLQGVYLAENWEEAIAERAQLRARESIVTRTGVWLGPNWLKMIAQGDPKWGIIQRQDELEQLTQQIVQQQQQVQVLVDKLAVKQAALALLEKRSWIQAAHLRDLSAKLSVVQSKLASQQAHFSHQEQRAQMLTQSLTEHQNNLRRLQQQLAEVGQQDQQQQQQQELYQQQRESLVKDRKNIQEQLDRLRQQDRETSQIISNIQLRSQAIQTQQNYLQQELTKLAQRWVDLQNREKELEQLHSQIGAPLDGLVEKLAERSAQQTEVAQQLQRCQQLNSEQGDQLRIEEKQYAQLQASHTGFQEQLTQLNLERQGLIVRQSTYFEQLVEQGLVVEQLDATVPRTATIAQWESQQADLSTKLEKIGLVNLAAIQEHQELSERRTYLATQQQDLVDALNTLEGAIDKIDRETQARFRDAYHQIDGKFQEFFPKIFKGGRAYLKLTTDDPLSAGVVVMAEPPGKRNTTIHSLSGGEKALTAIALVFAIFHLNPAPFCMLDEVDAPLDDLNVNRFGQLIQEMAQTIQFIFITHNKSTMGIAQQLIGVTMREPGVSRIVTVDVDEVARCNLFVEQPKIV